MKADSRRAVLWGLIAIVVLAVGLWYLLASIWTQKEVTIEDVRESSEEALVTARRYAGQQQERYIRQLRSDVQKLEEELQTFERASGQEIRHEIEGALVDLRKLQGEFIDGLQELQTGETRQWSNAQLERSLQNLRNAYSEVIDRLQGEETSKAAREHELVEGGE